MWPKHIDDWRWSKGFEAPMAPTSASWMLANDKTMLRRLRYMLKIVEIYYTTKDDMTRQQQNNQRQWTLQNTSQSQTHSQIGEIG